MFLSVKNSLFLLICGVFSYNIGYGQKRDWQKNHTYILGDIVVKESHRLFFKKLEKQSNLSFNIPTKATLIKDTLSLKLQKESIKKDSVIIKEKRKVAPQQYYTLYIEDKFALIQNINSDRQLLEYSQWQPKTQIITGITFRDLDDQFREVSIKKPTQVILRKMKGTNFYITKIGEREIKLPLDELIPYEVEGNYLCWGVNLKRKVKVVDIVTKVCDCPKGTSVDYKKVVGASKINIKKLLRL